jgi:large subunit ribosomal protein L3
MTKIISSKGEMIPVTAIKIENNVISQVKTIEKDGYDSCQIAFKDCKRKSLNKPLLGHLEKSNISLKKKTKEVRDMFGFKEGSSLAISDLFKTGDKVKVSGNSKGKGFAGVIKRYGFATGAMSHGGGYPHRLIGSMGGGRGSNQGIPKGKKMPGRMGNDKITQQTIIEKIDFDNQIIFLRGAVPGPKKGLIVIKKSL